MVYDLEAIESHPDKPLKVHINGVCQKASKRTDSVLAKYAALFHDFGKVNPNFQKKLQGIKSAGYSQHSYISAFSFLNWYLSNREEANRIFGSDGRDITKIKLITAIILHHHGNLPNMDENISANSMDAMIEFLEANSDELPISAYLQKQMLFQHNSFTVDIKPWYKNQIPNIDLGSKEIDYWKNDSLNYFLDTQFSFASVIESDKRDAGDNELYNYSNLLFDSINATENSFEKLFVNLGAKPQSELNQLRTEIRKEAVSLAENLLNNGQRVFTLAAPTGAGKTFTLLDIAREIQHQKGNLGIIYALPFLSITEQVQNIISKELNIDVMSVNSKSFNERIEKAQKEYETEQTSDKLRALLVEDFIENTFDHPFIITTFVQFFETLVSNRNSTLLKLPNFSNRIFLIDEFQALPPRLYIFFSAWLDTFCKKYNSYAVLSTATMPNLNFPNKVELENNQNYVLKNPQLLFKEYSVPTDLLRSQKFFENDVFNRYKINVIEEELRLENLKLRILQEEKSSLIILNTIQDTKDLYTELKGNGNVILLNTHFTPEDRLLKIEEVKNLLATEKVILISTQLIEAGVDIDFPVVYRDLCPLPSLIQSAGRCNRNKKQPFGQVYLFRFINSKGKYSSELVYRNEAKLFLDFIKANIQGIIQEKNLFSIQQRFFHSIAQNLEIGTYPEENINLIEEVNKAQFENVGKFQLINNKIFGIQYQFYVPKNDEDCQFESLADLIYSISDNNYESARKSKIDINIQLKKMSNRIIRVRIINSADFPTLAFQEPICGIYKIGLKNYNSDIGFKLNKEDAFL
ncbi:CRISPR-associated helicase, Cas3 family [Tangfeifania diversioriginum]|uniref:CRISPR-associated helicase, Cas3 family n=1 Tax=Tangfeifania diversioriginum TaxID=1168035 RepID=A0A1M6LJA6_9BACT|nr:CRISPR-associated helicase/endonuclease Cas3 [Tangfeifania diversioriginum]SHJ71264.1 CRISPR-associated helicase, Cas3 family [Tangfeifania diversioriginum]